ncbi:MAG: phage/plasmid primase, P4 family [Nitrososphaerales archaeon]
MAQKYELSDSALKDKLVEFLKSFKDERGELKYRIQAQWMAAEKRETFVVDLIDIVSFNSDSELVNMAIDDSPEMSFNLNRILCDAAHELISLENPDYAEKAKISISINNEFERLIPIRLHHYDKAPTSDQVASDLCKVFSFKTIAESSTLLAYSRGVYSESLATSLVAANVDYSYPQSSRHFVNEVIGHLERSGLVPFHEFENDDYVLNLANGFFDIKSETLTPHHPNRLSLVQLPFEFGVKAECPMFRKFLREVQPDEEDQTMIRYQIAYCFVRRPFMEKAFLHTGGGANGKSTFFHVLEALLGAANVSHISIQDFDEDTFAAAGVDRKLANIYPDVTDRDIEYTGKLKALISGDRISVHNKHQRRFDLYPYAKHFYSCNKLPIVHDDSDAWFRRWIIMNWNQKFEGSDQDRELAVKLTTKEELQGIFNWVLPTINKLLETRQFPDSADTDQVRKEWGARSDLILAWKNEKIKENAGKESFIPQPLLHENYVAWCLTNKYTALGKKKFNELLKTKVAVTIKEARIGKGHFDAWYNIAWKDAVDGQKQESDLTKY